MKGIVWGAFALIGASTASNALAQERIDYGSAVIQTIRNCGTNAAIACDGRGSGQGIAGRNNVGGQGQSINTTFAPGGANNAFASVQFSGFGFPEMKASVTSGATTRISDLVVAYQSYTYNGAGPLNLNLLADLHIDASSTDNNNGAFANGAMAVAGFAIWRYDDFMFYSQPEWAGDAGYSTAPGLTGQAFLFGAGLSCSNLDNESPNPLATNYIQQVLTGGETHVEVSQDVCGNANPLDENLVLHSGDKFVVASYIQLIGTRGGSVDATHTFNIGFGDGMSTADIANFQQNTTFASNATAAVPEPTTWAMMILGFGMVGGTLRQRRKTGTPALLTA
jgi:hypothetical protein